MSHTKAVAVIRGDAFTGRFASTITDSSGTEVPFSQAGRTLTFFLWRNWGLDNEELVLSFATAQDGSPADPRLVIEAQSGADVGKWRLELGAADTGALPEGVYRWSVTSVEDVDPNDVKTLVAPSPFTVRHLGELPNPLPAFPPVSALQGNIPDRWLPDVEIMTLGDSISVQSSPNSYQEYLYASLLPLVANRVNLRFIGTQNIVSPLWSEGHPSFRLDSVAAPSLSLTANLSTWLQLSPDVIVVHAGVNDIVSGEWTGSQAATNMTTLLTTIFSLLKGVRVIVCKIIGVTGAFSGFQSAINTFNAALDGVVNGLGSSVSDVMLVDCAAGFDVGTMLQGDGIHPNAAGAQHIANKVFDGIKIAGFGV